MEETAKHTKLLQDLNEEGLQFITGGVGSEKKVVNLSIVFGCKGKISFISDVLNCFEVPYFMSFHCLLNFACFKKCGIAVKHVETRTLAKSDDSDKFDLLIKCHCTKESFMKAATSLSVDSALLQVKIYTGQDVESKINLHKPIKTFYMLLSFFFSTLVSDDNI